MMKISRRNFIKSVGMGLLSYASLGLLKEMPFARAAQSNGRPKSDIKGLHDIVEATGGDPYKNTVEAVKAIGGMQRFVRKGSTVVVKPNMAWDRTPAQAANTEPQVVAAVVDMCYQAGAKRVDVFDIPCNEARRVYKTSGISEAAKAKGANVYFADDWNTIEAVFPFESKMEKWPVLRDAIECDTFINVPVLKDHRLTRLTLSMKNLMGVCGGDRGKMHVDIGEKLADLTYFVNPDLTVIDATRVLMKNGPVGGNLDDVQAFNKVLVATDPILADSYACSVVGVEPDRVQYIKAAVERGYGEADLSQADIKRIPV